MAKRLMWLSKLEKTERQVLELFRAAWTGAEPGLHGSQHAGAGGLLTKLAAEMRSYGIDIREPRSAFVSVDELWLIGAIASAQRSRLRIGTKTLFPHQPALNACGMGLWALEVELPFGAIGRHLRLVPGLKAPETSNGIEDVDDRTARLAMGSPRLRAISLLHSQDLVLAKDFVASGVSYKLQGELCKIGLMRRQARGVYARIT